MGNSVLATPLPDSLIAVNDSTIISTVQFVVALLTKMPQNAQLKFPSTKVDAQHEISEVQISIMQLRNELHIIIIIIISDEKQFKCF